MRQPLGERRIERVHVSDSPAMRGRDLLLEERMQDDRCPARIFELLDRVQMVSER